ncbi:MAG: glycoside hydrolase family 3 C-terminal domain-containing protein [Candidatus Moduliflexus flocculans]|nr:glycoside hydrolase family 3 C-terminal domain-containing protein [Candidatus Moduliflexus flocculans]
MDCLRQKSWVAAWWPGTEGGSGIADVLFGDYLFTGKTAYSWPRSMEHTADQRQ